MSVHFDSPPSRPLAVFRLEGVLWDRSAEHPSAWVGARLRDPGHRLLALGAAALSRPLSRPGRLHAPGAAVRLRWRGLKGCSEDRWVVLAEDYRTQVLSRHRHAPGHRMWDRCGAQGHTRVVVTAWPHTLAAPLADALGADALFANRLALQDGQLTGELVAPVLSDVVDGGWVRALAREHGAAPHDTFAYGRTEADAPLLSGVARPCAVTPAPALRRLATALDWPTVEA